MSKVQIETIHCVDAAVFNEIERATKAYYGSKYVKIFHLQEENKNYLTQIKTLKDTQDILLKMSMESTDIKVAIKDCQKRIDQNNTIIEEIKNGKEKRKEKLTTERDEIAQNLSGKREKWKKEVNALEEKLADKQREIDNL